MMISSVKVILIIFTSFLLLAIILNQEKTKEDILVFTIFTLYLVYLLLS